MLLGGCGFGVEKMFPNAQHCFGLHGVFYSSSHDDRKEAENAL
jgi:hypothetical protein